MGNVTLLLFLLGFLRRLGLLRYPSEPVKRKGTEDVKDDKGPEDAKVAPTVGYENRSAIGQGM